MAWQKPKENHPWRQYADRKFTVEETSKKKIKTVQTFICEIAESWDEVKVVTTAYSRYGEFKLSELPQEKQAAWLAGILRRNYGQI